VSQQYVLDLHIVTNCEHTETIMAKSRMAMTTEELKMANSKRNAAEKEQQRNVPWTSSTA
jgi:hypothetical protein